MWEVYGAMLALMVALLALMVVSRTIFSGFGGLLGSLFGAMRSHGESFWMAFGVATRMYFSCLVLEVILRGF